MQGKQKGATENKRLKGLKTFNSDTIWRERRGRLSLSKTSMKREAKIPQNRAKEEWRIMEMIYTYPDILHTSFHSI